MMQKEEEESQNMIVGHCPFLCRVFTQPPRVMPLAVLIHYAVMVSCKWR